MGRPPAPCGTISAAKRHRRKKEEIDAACLQAERDEKNARKEAIRAASSAVVAKIIATDTDTEAATFPYVDETAGIEDAQAPAAKPSRPTLALVSEPLDDADPPVVSTPRRGERYPKVNPLAEAHDNLRIVRALLQSGEIPANTVSALTRRRDELVDRIGTLSEGSTREVSALEAIEQRRRDRRKSASAD